MLRLEVWSDKADSSWDFFLEGEFLDGERPWDCLQRTHPDIAAFLAEWEENHKEEDEGFDSICEQIDDFKNFDTVDTIRDYLETGDHSKSAVHKEFPRET